MAAGSISSSLLARTPNNSVCGGLLSLPSLMRARKTAVSVRACREFCNPASMSPSVMPSMSMAPPNKEQVANDVRSASLVPVNVAPRQMRRGGCSASSVSASDGSRSRMCDGVPGLAIIVTIPDVCTEEGKEATCKLPVLASIKTRPAEATARHVAKQI